MYTKKLYEKCSTKYYKNCRDTHYYYINVRLTEHGDEWIPTESICVWNLKTTAHSECIIEWFNLPVESSIYGWMERDDCVL